MFWLIYRLKNNAVRFTKEDFIYIDTQMPTETDRSHYIDVIMGTVVSQITSLAIVYSTVYSGADQGKHQSSAPLAFVREIHRGRWIPRTKGQLRGKWFHLMTSSCVRVTLKLVFNASSDDQDSHPDNISASGLDKVHEVCAGFA